MGKWEREREIERDRKKKFVPPLPLFLPPTPLIQHSSFARTDLTSVPCSFALLEELKMLIFQDTLNTNDPRNVI